MADNLRNVKSIKDRMPRSVFTVLRGQAARNGYAVNEVPNNSSDRLDLCIKALPDDMVGSMLDYFDVHQRVNGDESDSDLVNLKAKLASDLATRFY